MVSLRDSACVVIFCVVCDLSTPAARTLLPVAKPPGLSVSEVATSKSRRRAVHP